MDKFKETIEKRKNLLRVLTIVLFITNAILFYISENLVNVASNIEYALGFLLGMIMGVLILGVVAIVYYGRVLKDEQKLKMLYIKENDERRKMISEKVAQSTLLTAVFVIMIAISIAAYFEPLVSLTLLYTIYAVAFIALGYKLYYKRKY